MIPHAAREFVDRYEAEYDQPMIPIIAGIKPLFNGRNAEFLHNEVPGIVIPRELRQRMQEAVKPQEEGVRISQEILAPTAAVYAWGLHDARLRPLRSGRRCPGYAARINQRSRPERVILNGVFGVKNPLVFHRDQLLVS